MSAAGWWSSRAPSTWSADRGYRALRLGPREHRGGGKRPWDAGFWCGTWRGWPSARTSAVGVVDLDGQGDTVGGIVVMRSAARTLNVIHRVKEKIESVRLSLPPGVEMVTTYDRSELIQRSIDTLRKSCCWR